MSQDQRPKSPPDVVLDQAAQILADATAEPIPKPIRELAEKLNTVLQARRITPETDNR